MIKVRSNRYCKLFLCLCLGFMFVSPEFVRLFADKNYWGGINLIPLIVLSIFFTFLYSFGVNFELYLRKTKWIAIGTTAAAGCKYCFKCIIDTKCYELCRAGNCNFDFICFVVCVPSALCEKNAG